MEATGGPGFLGSQLWSLGLDQNSVLQDNSIRPKQEGNVFFLGCHLLFWEDNIDLKVCFFLGLQTAQAKLKKKKQFSCSYAILWIAYLHIIVSFYLSIPYLSIIYLSPWI